MSVETVEQPEVAIREKVPVWLPPVFGFIAGTALMYGVMKPINDTPDYQRGHSDGVSMGIKIATEMSSRQIADLFKAGVKSGRYAEKNGLPDPVPPQ